VNLQLKENLKENFLIHTEVNEIDEVKIYLLPHVDLIFRCACRLARKQHDAEDLTQDTFYYAIKNYSQLKDRDKAKNWLFSILKNLFLKEVARNKRQGKVDFDLVSNTLSSAVNLESELLHLETKTTIRRVLNRLDERLRRPIEMFYFERLSYKEIAAALDLPIGTVMSRIARGKVYLKRDLSRTPSLKS